MKEIYELIFLTEQQNGNLIVTKESDLRNNELAEIQSKMLSTNYIPRLIPLEIEEQDFKVKLRYNISGKQSLRAFYESNNFTPKQYYQIIYNIVSIIDDSNIYMLNKQNYLLLSDLIFVGQDSYDIHLIYLPLISLPKKTLLEIEIKNLAYELAEKVINNRNHINELLVYLEQEFNIQSLKKKLLSLMTSSKQHNKSNYTNLEVNQNKVVFPINSPLRLEKTNDRLKDTRIKEPLRALSEREKTILYSVTIFVIALVWKFYTNNQSEGLMYISFGLTFLLIDIDLVLTKLWRPSLKSEGNSKAKATNKNKLMNIEAKSSVPNIDETTLLTEKLIPITINNAFLERNSGNEYEQILLNRDSFIIGRNISTVDYVENTKGVSRIHLEIKRGDDCYFIKDLYSKNGSFLNDEELKPNLHYPIKDGDIIKIGKAEFTFRS